MELIYISNNPEIGSHAELSGVDRIMIDLECLGKRERQGHRDTLISGHTIEDISRMKGALSLAKLQVRVNPINSLSETEINEAIDRGADIVMLPMFKSKQEVEKFVSLVNGRARTSLLLETSQALVRIDDILQVDGIDEVYIGLNDLHLSMGLDFMFELVTGGIIDYAANKIRKRRLPFGFGGVSKLGTGIVDARLVLSEHVRIGSEIVILSRAFHGGATSVDELKALMDLGSEISKIRSHLSNLALSSEKELFINRDKISRIVSEHIAGADRQTSFHY